MLKASLAEIMESIQGEGILVGSRQIFVRFSGCNLRCAYCDTPASLEVSPSCVICPHTGHFDCLEYLPNPLSVDQVVTAVTHYSSRWISLTGGEPLLWADFILEMGLRLRPPGYKFMLETNGTLCEQLEICLPSLDLISMDFKLPSSTGVDNMVQHERFLARAGNTPIYVKMVIDAGVQIAEVKAAVKIITAFNHNIPLILQPVTPVGKVSAPNLDALLEMQRMCLESLADVRIIPQMHRYMGLT